MNSNKSGNNPAPTPLPQQNDIVNVLVTSILTLEQDAKRQVEKVNKLKTLLFKYISSQQQQTPKLFRARISRNDSHRLQPYPRVNANSLQSSLLQQQPASVMQNIDQLSKQNSFQHYTNMPQQQLQPTPSEFSSNEYLSLLQQSIPIVQVTDQFGLQESSHNTHNLQSLPSQQSQSAAQSTGLLEQQPIEKFGLTTSHYHAKSPLPQQLLNPPSTQVTNQFDLMAGQNSPHHNTHNLSSSPKRPLVPPAQVTEQYGHLMLGQIPTSRRLTSQQLTSHMILGEAFPFPSGPDFDNNEFQNNK